MRSLRQKSFKAFTPSYVIFCILILLLSGCGGGGGGGSSSETGGTGGGTGTISLAWDAVTTNADGSTCTDLAGYKIYYGTASGQYGTPKDVGNITTYDLTGLTAGQTYYIVTTAYDTSNNESSYSNEVHGVAQ